VGKRKIKRAKSWLKLVPPEHPTLNYPAEILTGIDDVTKTLINDLFWLLSKHGGLGLSATQVGCSRSVFVMNCGERVAVINPVIVQLSNFGKTLLEGCLTFPDQYVEIERPNEVRIQYMNEKFRQVERSFYDLEARCVLHEIDHLNGKLITAYGDLVEGCHENR